MTLLLIYFVKSRLDACFLTVGMGHDVCIYDPGWFDREFGYYFSEFVEFSLNKLESSLGWPVVDKILLPWTYL